MNLTYKELQEKLKELEPEIGQIPLNVSKKKLEEIYQNYLDKQEPAPSESILCPLCGKGHLTVTDNWATCDYCHYKKYEG